MEACQSSVAASSKYHEEGWKEVPNEVTDESAWLGANDIGRLDARPHRCILSTYQRRLGPAERKPNAQLTHPAGNAICQERRCPHRLSNHREWPPRPAGRPRLYLACRRPGREPRPSAFWSDAATVTRKRTDLDQRAYELRQQELTYRAIAKWLGVTLAMARRRVLRHERMLPHDRPITRTALASNRAERAPRRKPIWTGGR